MSTLTRRLFMKCLPAAPVVAKEAAKKMGMEIGASSAQFATMQSYSGLGGVGEVSHAEYIKRQLLGLSSEREQTRRLENAKWSARQIDPDIASMRSISPSFAYAVQADRCAKRMEASDRRNLLWELADCMEAGI